MNEMRIFENEQFGKVRTVVRDGEPWFVAADVCRALEIDRSQSRRLDEDEKGVYSIHTPGGAQDVTIVNEPGLYSLVLRSRKPEAKAFKRWITHEVIPSIRKTGGYIAGENQMSDDELVARALLMLKKKLEARNLELDQARGEIREKDAQIQRLAPKASYCDLVLQAKEAVPISLIAKDYGLSARTLNAMLHDMRIQYKVDDMWLLYQPLTKKGYTKSVTYLTDSGVLAMRTLWTQKGRMFLYEKLKEKGILPEMEQTENGNLPKGVIPFDGRACPAH